jgi:hypothetical protein
LNTLQKQGHQIGIITWLGKNATTEYNQRVAEVKIKWLKQHLATVQFDEIHIVAYGTPKQNIGRGILFDDEALNRNAWGVGAYEPKDIFKILQEI